VRADPDAWVYALVSLQTMSGFYGVGNRGISRMNGGFGNRPVVEIVRSFRPGVRWRDAVSRLLDHRREVLGSAYGYDPRGIVLVWTEPWDGKTALPLTLLDPFYVEVCRRVRLKGDGRPTHAEAVASVADRIAASELRGAVGDAWLPIDLRESSSRGDGGIKALTVGPRGWDADLIRRLIFADELKLTPLQRPDARWQGDVWLSASVLVRGQGTTDGFHERRVAIPAAARLRVFGPPERRQPLAELSKTGVEYAGRMQNRVLRPAVLTYLATATSAADRESYEAWWRGVAGRFQARWTDAFFTWLWSVPEPFDEQLVSRQWALQLRDFALEILREAERFLPTHIGRRFQARVAAERRFWTGLYANGNFPFLREEAREDVGVA
ncbi:MAG: type I-E CRISPR-associated protein Cse1/CasA, partial [Firmicutes bacterium]|nr:type I-E CRISPR-associated protein Cse1/CasA [Bacillota bacterium]